MEFKHNSTNYPRKDGGPPAKRTVRATPLDTGFKLNLQALANAADAVESGTKSPVSALGDLGVQVSHTVLQQDDLAQCPRFTVAVTVADMTFEGWGYSEWEARNAAARACLAALLARGDRLLPAPPGHQVLARCNPPNGQGSRKKLAAARVSLGTQRVALPRAHSSPCASCALPLSQLLTDHVARLVNEKFNELMHGDLVHSEWKVLAGIVITINHSVEGARVIAVTTGTKCISGENMSVRGMALNDCHAEVVARRCLQRHLYAQLLMYASSPDPRKPIPQSDLEPLPDGGYQFKKDRQVHLYVSTVPCGDGRICRPYERNESEPDKRPNKLACGQLRTKIESSEGTISVKNCNKFIQTMDSVLQSERLLTMSCSDKIARWCVVGLQGALLARLLRPVYMHALVVGSCRHPHNLYRAICGRIENHISSLPSPFRLNRPILTRPASIEARTPVRAPSFSVCWSCTSPVPEIVNTTTGKLMSGQPSLLCKQSMFARWQYLVTRLPLLPYETEPGVLNKSVPSDLENLPYNEAKQLCTTYQVAKECLVEAFEKANLGRWVKKPIELDNFVCDIHIPDPNALFALAGNNLHVRNTVHSGTTQLNEFEDVSINSYAQYSECTERRVIENEQNESNNVANVFAGSSKHSIRKGGTNDVDKEISQTECSSNNNILEKSSIVDSMFSKDSLGVDSNDKERKEEHTCSFNNNKAVCSTTHTNVNFLYSSNVNLASRIGIDNRRD
ncbi:unnamed protein product [Parnassius apollo]|uniref:(apollo) hypothetical protein n=1 Tax=Parnassius apollo TaxID=110799 RepID=A0A8S3WEJ7_PARAO|nr:unnamed protein product [Parnassius apollo]